MQQYLEIDDLQRADPPVGAGLGHHRSAYRSAQRLVFGRFELQTDLRRLLADGQPLPLRTRALDVLMALAQQPGRLVSRRELLDRVWGVTVVEENNLSVQIHALRRALGDGMITTVPGRGYRFEGVVAQAGAGADTDTDTQADRALRPDTDIDRGLTALRWALAHEPARALALAAALARHLRERQQDEGHAVWHVVRPLLEAVRAIERAAAAAEWAFTARHAHTDRGMRATSMKA